MAAITHVHDCDIERRDSPTALNGDFRDTHLEDDNPTTNFNGPANYAGVSAPLKGSENVLRMLFLYDLNAFIPAGATITAAVLWFYVQLVYAPSAQHVYRIQRLTRTDWKEDEATWNVYKTGSNWMTPGGDTSTPQITLGAITTTGWKNYDILTMVSDARSNRAGICTFLLDRDVAQGPVDGYISVSAKEQDNWAVHHLRITYTLDGKTFEVILH